MAEDIKNLGEKYSEKIAVQLGTGVDDETIETESVEYEEFKKENMPPPMTWYENACNQSEKLLKMKPNAKKAAEMQEAIDACHLNITPTGAASFAMLMPMLVILVFGLLSFVLLQSMFLLTFFTFAGLLMMIPLQNMPKFFATKWRMDASKEMVLSVFYVVTYMRHTSNLEKGIQFASEHLSGSLSLDLKRVLWNIQTEKYSTIKESLDDYLEYWRETNMEFVEAFHLIESSLYEGYEERRLAMLDKSLDVILDGTYEKMLHYAQNLKSPINTLNMLGVILPILGLVILPLVVSFMGDVQWYHISVLYNIGLPVAVYFLGKSILSTRPSGYGASDIKGNKEKRRHSFLGLHLTTFALALTVGIILLLIGFSPMIIHLFNPEFDLSLVIDRGIQVVQGNVPEGQYQFLDYQEKQDDPGVIIGPFGLGASLLSVFVPMSIGVAVGLYYKLKSADVLKMRQESQKLELEFSSALFQLGNRLSDGYPAEIVFDRVAGVMGDSPSGRFFSVVSNNVTKLGMSVENAIFDKHTGALKSYSSNLVASSMKVLIQSIKKGPSIAAAAMANVARYVKEIHRVNERLKDLMAEIVASINGQIKFLTPAISGIVVGITCMITSILGKLSTQMKNMSSLGGAAGGGGLMEMFGQGIPTFHFQAIVGIYVVQLAYILIVIKNGIENGEDKMAEEYSLGSDLLRSTILYCVIAFIVMLLFNMIASAILGSTLQVEG